MSGTKFRPELHALEARLKSFDTNVSIDLGGGSPRVNVLVGVGVGDTDPTTRATVSLVTNVANARVGAGTDTWTPPGVIVFPHKLKKLP